MENELESEVIRAKGGSHEAFVNLIKPLELQMYNTARAIVKKDEDCADAMQETILKAYKSLASLEQPTYFKTWLFRILINECNMILRKRSQAVAIENVQNIQQSSPDAANSMDLHDAVYRLEEVSRTIVILHYFRDLPLRQVAELLDLSEGAVKTRLHRARTALYEWLGDYGERKMNL